MAVHPFDSDQFWKVNIHWKRPIAYKRIIEDGCQHDQDANLYHILGKYSTFQYKSFYIGLTYKQCVSKRLNQKDHKNRYAALLKEHPRHTFWVSCGVVEIDNGKKTRKRLKDIETILIHTNWSNYAFNVANVYGHGVKGSYSIECQGYRCGLPRRLHLGIFAG
jgi:hypothetical protein